MAGLVWAIIIGIGAPTVNTSNGRRKRSEADFSEGFIYPRTDYWDDLDSRTTSNIRLTDAELLETFDSVFTFASTTKQFVVNAVSVRNFMIFKTYSPFYILDCWRVNFHVHHELFLMKD